jgi:Fe2+ or Zn2+ uptake regulation protein
MDGFAILDLKERKRLNETKNLRTTQQRMVILEELRSKNNHPSADELYERVRKKLPRISLGTVYRNLEVLSQLGEIQKLNLSGSLKRYDGIPGKHYHIRCINCDRVDDAPIAPLNQIEDELYQATVFEIIGHNLEFTGLCPACTLKNQNKHNHTISPPNPDK